MAVNIAGTSTTGFVQLSNVILDVYAKEILFKAQPVLKFESICVKKTDLQAQPGHTIRFLKYDSLTGSDAIAETATVTPTTITTSTVAITVTEHIRAVSLTEYLLRSALTDCLADATTVLGQFYAKNRDALVRDTILGSAGSLLYSQAGGTTTTRAGLAATSTFNVDLIRDAVETLATNKAPKFGGDAYVCFVHSHQAKYLRKDSAWISVQYYANPANLLTGEIGRIEDVRFIETTQIPYIAKGAGSQAIYADGEDTGATATGNANTAVYRAIIVGDWAVGLAEALPVELRDNGVEDYGRKHSVGYYGIWGAGAIETGHMAILETA